MAQAIVLRTWFFEAWSTEFLAVACQSDYRMSVNHVLDYSETILRRNILYAEYRPQASILCDF